MEPTPQDVAAVAQATGAQPPAAQSAPQPAAPQPEPQQPVQQPAAPTPQPAPTQQQGDPFASLFASEPEAPTEPVAAPQPPQPPEQPLTPQPLMTPSEPSQAAPQVPQQQPQPQAPATKGDDYQSFEDYMNSVTKEVPKAPDQPDPSKINPDDPTAIKGFFDDLVNSAVAKAEANFARKQALQSSERKLWDDAFDKYGSLKANKSLRDMVHNIRMGYFQRGVALTPTQAADELLKSLNQQYKKGVADNQVQTTIEQAQPTAGSGTPVPTTLDANQALKDVQAGGEQALAAHLDSQIKAGKL